MPNGVASFTEGQEFHGRYVVERTLGAGAMGVVYLAMDSLTRRQVALKLIHPALLDNPSAKQRLIKEGLITRDICHPNIVAVYDVNESDEQVYFVMEYLPGQTLRTWLRRTLQISREIPYAKAFQIISNVLEGLTAAHAASVVHRDLKPENIMLTGLPEEGDCSLKILDFGVARASDNAWKYQTATTLTGTPLYMAPEQYQAADTVGPPADLYSVTVIFYELLIGVTPGLRWAPFAEEFAKRSDRADVVVDWLSDVIEKGLSSRPRNRYQTAGEHLDALHKRGIDPYYSDRIFQRARPELFGTDDPRVLDPDFRRTQTTRQPVATPLASNPTAAPAEGPTCRKCGCELGAGETACARCSSREAGPLTISGIETVFSPEPVNMPSALPTLAEGQEFNRRYVIKRMIGAGAMGIVYLAHDKLTERQVALKLLHPALVDSDTARKRFIRECLIACNIHHPNIAAVYDVNENDGTVYLVMEHVEGETLRDMLCRAIQSGEDIPLPKARRIVEKILEGIAPAHETGVVHRDLKPENIILLKGSNEDCRLKILDFGIAHVVGHLTSTGAQLYMAPEQKTAPDSVGPSADLYSVTAIFYELLIGVAPGGSWVPLSKQRPDIPPDIDELVYKGLSSMPRARYQTAQEYLSALDQALDPIEQARRQQEKQRRNQQKRQQEEKSLRMWTEYINGPDTH